MSADNNGNTSGASGVENVTPYHSGKSKSGQVEEMFDSIAPAYDLMNTAMTFGLHRRWRDRALKIVAADRPRRVLDVATGTGDVAFSLFRRCRPEKVVGLDLSAGMLAVARRKLAESPYEEMRRALSFEQGDSLDMRFPDDSFDAITVAYGVRNFEHLEEGYREMTRVLRPGGLLCVIELSQPRSGLTRAAYNLYSRRLIPLVGRLVSGDTRAYTYLPESIASAPQRDDMTALMRRAGLTDTAWKSLTFGAVTIYTARKPLPSP